MILAGRFKRKNTTKKQSGKWRVASEILTKKTADGRGAAGEGDLEVDEGDFLSSPVIGTSGGEFNPWSGSWDSTCPVAEI